jgi:hypothetical protein
VEPESQNLFPGLSVVLLSETLSEIPVVADPFIFLAL